ncbi:MAG: hypothetical protein WC770_10220 [Phycisphaerae bacterium]|jgi:hypothetical protein
MGQLERVSYRLETLPSPTTVHCASAVYTILWFVSFTEEPDAICGAGSYVAFRRKNMVDGHWGILERHISKWL